MIIPDAPVRAHLDGEHATASVNASAAVPFDSNRIRAGFVLLLGALTAIGPFTIDMYLAAFPQITADMHTQAGQDPSGQSSGRNSHPALRYEPSVRFIPKGAVMSDALLYEVSAASVDDYMAVQAKTGLDPTTGSGDWPAGMISHTGAAGANGSFVIFEVWDSRQSQEAFMESRLGPALAASGVPTPTRTEWLSVVGYYTA